MKQRTSNISRLFRCNFTKAIEDSSMSLVVSMREVESGYIHSSVHQLGNSFFRPAGRTNGTDNLGPTIFGNCWALDHVKRDETTREGTKRLEMKATSALRYDK
jgi:hypothetical protein